MLIFNSPAWRSALAGLFALALAMGIGRFAYTPILPFMLEAGIFSPTEAGFAAGANFLGYLLGALGAALPVFAPRRILWMAFALATSVVTTIVSGLWFNIEVFYLLRFLSGVSSAFSMVFASTIVLQNLQQHGQSRLISVHFAGVGVGISLSAGLVSLILGNSVNWSAHWFATGLVALVLLIPVAVLLPQKKQAASRTETAFSLAVESGFSRSFWFLLTGYGAFGFGYSVSATFINTIAKSDPSLTSAEPYVWLVVGIAILPSTWFWYRIADHVGIAYAYMAACLVEAFGVCLLLWYPGPVPLLLSGALLGGTFVAITAIGLAKSRELAGDKAPQALALMTASFGLGQMSGPVFAGYSFERTGSFALSLSLAAVFLVLTVAFTFASKWSENKR